ncbi:glycosyltransferase [Candidatus Oleimmundimicrobium sp.]|uniref:glycosyltransferase n=1 Tax=Candidatus Oleimmundimicrobium sp. TaxID=3060597 RepID=UPI00272672F4|nr:glycosyltransferase [Candidatus Oleimmundimicrobium sp.]MDO8886359.1 glycosyltransferase [Candidatus Oleimmundimicrobium sp.]
MIYIVIPAYDEEKNIGQLLKQIDDVLKGKYLAIVVDDGSTDKTGEIVEEMASKYPIRCLHNMSNQGLGITLRNGLREAVNLSLKGDVIITMDGDATHDPNYIPSMVEGINGADVIIASRFLPGAGERGLSNLRKILSRGAGSLLRCAFTIKDLRDYTSGYRAFKAELIEKAFRDYNEKFITEKGFSATPEILIKLRQLDAKFKEVPFILKYDAKKGTSKINIPITIVRYLKMIFKFKVRGF